MTDDKHAEADPTRAATVKVRFTVDDGEVRAERLDLSDEFPVDFRP